MAKKIHYCGQGVKYMLVGWAVCCSGDKCIRINDDGNQTADISGVTCKSCLKKMADSGIELMQWQKMNNEGGE